MEGSSGKGKRSLPGSDPSPRQGSGPGRSGVTVKTSARGSSNFSIELPRAVLPITLPAQS